MSIYDNDGFDSDAYVKASKALHIVFILLILLVNGLLIVKNVRKPDFMYKPKTLTILSLAIGDVLLALFPMVVKTKYLFGDYILTGLSCSLFRSVFVYTPFLVTFVYSIGLMVLGFEIINSHKNSLANKNTQIIYSLAYSSLPWILGLIIVLPLGMTNFDDVTCRSSQTMGQGRALFIIGIILPACGAVITSIFVKQTTPPRLTGTAQGLVVTTTQTTTFTTQNPNPEGVIPLNHGQPSMNVPPPPTLGRNPYYPQQQPQVYNHHPQQQPQVYYQPPQQPYPTPGQIQNANPTYYPGNVQPYMSQTGAVITPATVSSPTAPKVNRLLAVSVVIFFLVIPIAIYFLSYTLNEDAVLLVLVLSTAINDFVFWLNNLRSVITPLMMYGYSDD